MSNFFSQPWPLWAKLWWAIAFLICAVIVLFGLPSCADKDQPPTMEERLQGAWQRDWGMITNRYNFHGGGCDEYRIIPGQPGKYYSIVYTCDVDTLTMLDLAGGNVSRAVVEFPSDSTAVLMWIGGVNYFLKRL